tara:strand:+ start:19 stop:150 length:132 start_codon:yes stop_codon:yes gene_type:complete
MQKIAVEKRPNCDTPEVIEASWKDAKLIEVKRDEVVDEFRQPK